MYLPKCIYELVPYIYMLIGVNAAIETAPVYGRISGILLTFLGVLITYMRYDYRRN